MILPIIQWPDLSLRRVSQEVLDPDASEVRKLVDDMFDTMYAGSGVGLSAIQVGTTWRLFVMDAGRHGPIVLINPHLIFVQGDVTPMREGCLSIPGVYENIDRHPEIVVQYQSRQGITTTWFEGVEAQCVAHELEHLAGGLFVDKLSPFKRERILKKLDKHIKLTKNSLLNVRASPEITKRKAK